MESWRQVVAEVQAGHVAPDERRALFGELVEYFRQTACTYACTLLGDPQLAEDAVQEAFLAAYCLLPQLQEPGAFPAWLRRIVHTQCHRVLRARRVASQPLESVDLAAEGLTPEDVVEQLELVEAVQAAVEALPAGQRLPVRLYYLHDYSQREIAEALDLSVAAVKKRLERARYRLGERMRGMAQDYLQFSAGNQGEGSLLLNTLMEAAALEGQFVLLEALVVEGMDVDEPDDNGQTLLHWAARAGHVEAVELLLMYDPDLSLRDQFGKTPLDWAEEGGHRQVARLLRQGARSGGLP